MKILEQIKYILFEIKNPLGFRLIYLLEKIIKIPVLILRNILNLKQIKIPYLFRKDYYIYNINGKWLIKAKTDYDYTITPYVEKELEPFFISKGIFLDIGTHIGKWSVFVAKNGGDVYSFEPNPETFNYLNKNIELNNYIENIKSFNVGIGEKKGKLNFLIDENETSKSMFSSEGGIEVKVITIDDFINENKLNISKIDLIKIDTEGFEFNVLKGMKKFLSETKNVKIICEILDSQEDKKEIFNFLKEYGFIYKKLPTPADYLFYKKN